MSTENSGATAMSEQLFAQASALRRNGRPMEAIGLLRQLLSIQPKYLPGAMGLADLLAETNQIDEAILGFQYILSLDPNQLNSALKLGVLLATHGQLPKAANAFLQATRIDPNSAAAQRYLGTALNDLGAFTDAIGPLQTAIGLEPTHAESFMLLGNTFSNLGRFQDAEQCYSTAIGFDSGNPMPYISLGTCLARQEKYQEALTCFWKAIAIDPKCSIAYTNAGIANESLGQLEDAEKAFAKVIELEPENSAAITNRGVILDRLGEFDEAQQCFEEALNKKPDYVPAYFNLGMCWLRNGDWVRGFEAYESRTRLPDAKQLATSKPSWNGEPLTGKTILVVHEQGIGDCVQFIRYLPLLKQRGARVLLNCRRSMRRLLMSCDGIDEFFPIGDAFPYHDFYIPLASLPKAFHTTPETVPNQIPYLHPEAERVAYWKRQVAQDVGFKIGIIWRGNPAYHSDRYRSVELEYFEALGRVANIQFYNLQKEDVREDMERASNLIRIRSFGDELDRQAAFVDTAALMQCLDLVISVDSAPVHVAGAIGIPVWLVLAYNNDWRWLKHREDTPWYPTMRIYRRNKSEDWEPVFAKMAFDLKDKITEAKG